MQQETQVKPEMTVTGTTEMAAQVPAQLKLAGPAQEEV